MQIRLMNRSIVDIVIDIIGGDPGGTGGGGDVSPPPRIFLGGSSSPPPLDFWKLDKHSYICI